MLRAPVCTARADDELGVYVRLAVGSTFRLLIKCSHHALVFHWLLVSTHERCVTNKDESVGYRIVSSRRYTTVLKYKKSTRWRNPFASSFAFINRVSFSFPLAPFFFRSTFARVSPVQLHISAWTVRKHENSSVQCVTFRY